jgi:hypothetical protein
MEFAQRLERRWNCCVGIIKKSKLIFFNHSLILAEEPGDIEDAAGQIELAGDE